ncbi:ADP-ribosyl cyclase/cyclic ADP-ribose hydrolase 1-like [Acanthochromis polyacanthus]|uniref:ADP-ribosyl cyclase/cyclic ADP-ribose hydrolase n=1 Tax=Acanthochromis polyacanthus TaxID=80966 RepID=A0A3Q1GKK1_9TELE|nr:ADP-ribosyl cyclase/cyclic ADP-ribose hydrolase 1-like [Acanthochromis polyacanthus]
MDHGEPRRAEKRRRRRRVALCVVAVLLLVIIVAVVLGVTLRKETETNQFQSVFLSRCETFKGNNCQKIWETFQQAYVNRDPCKVPMEAYDPLVTAAPFKPTCNRVMFWSKTKVVVHEFTEKTDCFVTLEDTLLGYVLDGLTWCGKEGSSETFTTDCPVWTDCENNTVSSFWKRVSAAYADIACGNVSAMLNGSIAVPFSPTSIFGSIEVKGLNATRVNSLTVVLVTEEENVTNCTDASLKVLQKELPAGINYGCEEVPESQLQECGSDPQRPCGSCW